MKDNYFSCYVDDPYDIECKPNPKELNLILAYDAHKTSNTEDRQNIYKVVRAA